MQKKLIFYLLILDKIKLVNHQKIKKNNNPEVNQEVSFNKSYKKKKNLIHHLIRHDHEKK